MDRPMNQRMDKGVAHGWINAGDNGSVGCTNGDHRAIPGLPKGNGRRIRQEHSGIRVQKTRAATAKDKFS